LLRVPFVQRCSVSFNGGLEQIAFIVNINILGAYLTCECSPGLGEGVHFHFKIPGNDLPVVASGRVAWVNPSQAHPVHSLPPGFGLKFEGLSAEAARRIEEVVEAYIARQAPQL
jgi:Tfp pilus assembly protein PilZ